MSPSGSVITLSRSGSEGALDAEHDGGPVGFDLGTAFDEHGSALFGFAVNALRDRGLAEDCVQETFLRAWRARDRFDPGRASARTWLFAIQRNVIVDVFRSQQRMPRLAPAEALEHVSADVADPTDRLRLVEGLAKLSTAHRQVLEAVHLEGASYAEVSRASGVPVPTLRTRAYHALRALRGHLDVAGERPLDTTVPPEHRPSPQAVPSEETP